MHAGRNSWEEHLNWHWTIAVEFDPSKTHAKHWVVFLRCIVLIHRCSPSCASPVRRDSFASTSVPALTLCFLFAWWYLSSSAETMDVLGGETSNWFKRLDSTIWYPRGIREPLSISNQSCFHHVYSVWAGGVQMELTLALIVCPTEPFSLITVILPHCGKDKSNAECACVCAFLCVCVFAFAWVIWKFKKMRYWTWDK